VPVYQAAGGAPGRRLTLGIWAVPALIGAAVWLPQLRYRTLPARRPADAPFVRPARVSSLAAFR